MPRQCDINPAFSSSSIEVTLNESVATQLWVTSNHRETLSYYSHNTEPSVELGVHGSNSTPNIWWLHLNKAKYQLMFCGNSLMNNTLLQITGHLQSDYW